MHDDEHEHAGDPDWEGVEVHTHADGTRHMTLNARSTRRDVPWWRQAIVWRYFRVEIGLLAMHLGVVTCMCVFIGVSFVTFVYAGTFSVLMFSNMARSVRAYRIGYAMGIAVVPLAMQQKTPKLAAELIDRSSELWDPTPEAVAHTMSIERLERDVNRGTL